MCKKSRKMASTNGILLMAAVLVLPFLASAEKIQVNQISRCSGEPGYGTAKIQKITISPCKEANMTPPRPCVLKKGTEARIKIYFNPTVASPTAVNAFATSGGLRLPGMDNKACGRSMNCPLIPNKLSIYRNQFLIQSFFPPNQYNVKWSLEGGPFKLCFVVPIEVSD